MQRTSLSWRRTALSLFLLALTATRVVLPGHGVPRVAAYALIAGAGGLLIVITLLRRSSSSRASRTAKGPVDGRDFLLLSILVTAVVAIELSVFLLSGA